MIKNNNVGQDTQGVRIERLTLLSANIGAYGPLISISAPKIAMAETAFEDYVGAVAEAGIQDGQMDEAYETYAQAVKATARFYALVRAHLQEIIWDFDKPDDFLHAYGFEGDSPTWYSGLVPKIKRWEENHALLVAAGDPRVIADSVLADLADLRDVMVPLQVIAFAEGRESSEAYDALHELYAGHTKLLRFILTGAHLVWGNEDPRLVELGFQTASGVWTPGQPEPGEPEPPENWDDAPTDFTVTKTAVGDSIDIKCGLHPDADGINVYHAEGPYGGGGVIPLRPASAEWVEAPMPLQVDVAYNMRHWLWVCAVKDGVEGAFAGPLWIEFTE